MQRVAFRGNIDERGEGGGSEISWDVLIRSLRDRLGLSCDRG